MLIQLFYISKAAEGLTAKDHADILATARKNNRPLGVTGLLVVKGAYFAQALEGEEDVVLPLFDKIKLDKRHAGVVRISYQKIQSRIFPSWDMGFKDINQLGGHLAEIDLADPKYVKDPANLSMVFKNFIEE